MNNQNQQDNQRQQNDIRSEIRRPYKQHNDIQSDIQRPHNQQNGYQRQPSR